MVSSSSFIITFIIISAILVFFFIQFHKENVNKEKLRIAQEKDRIESERIRQEAVEAKRLKEKHIIENHFNDFSNLNIAFEQFLKFENGYFTNRKISLWKLNAQSIFDKISQIIVVSVKLDSDTFIAINKFKQYYLESDKLRKEYNKEFIKNELKECESLFSNIDNASLDEQQRLAIVKDEDNNLIIAGAGSGKTTTVAGKVVYIIDRLKLKPDEILLITFTKKASDEMKERIKNKMRIDIEVNTFHGFGRKVIGTVTNNMPSVIEENIFYSEMKSIFNTLMKDSHYSNMVIKFLTEYNLETKNNEDFDSHGEYVNYMKDNNIKSYKTTEKKIEGRITTLRETCKSLEEVKIANFLFLNGVNYKYEDPYKHPTSNDIYAQYKPDFYLPDNDVYIEHFGLIDENNNVPHWFSSSNGTSAKDKYNSDIAWKRDIHKMYQTTLIETFSYENKADILLRNLEIKLSKAGVVIKPRTTNEIWKILNSIAKDDVTALDTLIKTFLNLFKSNNYEMAYIKYKINDLSDVKTKNRYDLFIQIFEPIFNKYNDYLKSNNLIDFSDMINEAADYIANNKFKNKYKYIIIDEFQDTSISRFNLIKALLNNDKECRLFAVGDDWQSIYRFAGSDISLFTEFEKHFGATEISKIETTYRFSKNMIDLSSKFILANPNQTSKQLKPYTINEIEPIEILYGKSFKNDDPFPLIEALEKINSENSKTKSKVKIIALSRYNHFIELYKERKDLFSVTYDKTDKIFKINYLKLPHLQVDFLTVHRSKGLQADYTIILNCVSGSYGFPSEQADDPILNLLLSKSDQFPNGEERRLFYVALTRSKRKTFITTNSVYKSKFIKEIDPNYNEDPKSKCPKCKLGDKIRTDGVSKYGKSYIRYTCSNWNYDCDYLEWG